MNEALASLKISHDGFVFNSSTGDSFMVNPTALLILQNLQDGIEADRIAGELTGHFDVDAEEAELDVAEFLGRLKSMALL